MNYSISFVQRANIHLSKAIEWCQEQNTGFEIKLLKSIDKNLKDIKKNPYKYQIRYDEVRIIFLKNPKFGIHYIIRNEKIYIVGLFHTSQDSENW